MEHLAREDMPMAGAIQPDLDLAASLFEGLSRARAAAAASCATATATATAAHDITRSAADAAGLEVSIDPIGNLSMTLPGRDRSAPRIVMGSHLDSVPQAATSTGAAGVVAGVIRAVGDEAARFVARLRSVRDGDPRGGVRLVRHRLSGQRAAPSDSSIRLPLDSKIRQWPKLEATFETAGL